MPESATDNFVARNRFLILLATQAALLMSGPLLISMRFSGEIVGIVMTGVLCSMLLASVLAVSGSRRHTTIAAALIGPLIAIQIISIFADAAWLEWTRHLLGMVALGYIIVMLTMHLMHAKRVTRETIAESLCVYLLIGVLWSLLYSLMAYADHEAFHYAYANTEDAMLGFHGERSISSLYYSFVTLSTLGYGDVVPASSAARMFAIVEAIVGQLYLVVLVARLVGLQISTSMQSE